MHTLRQIPQAVIYVRGDILTDKESLDLLRAYFAIPAIKRRRLFDRARVLSKG